MNDETERTDSKFGRGLCYCLGLFLCHSEREYRNKKMADIIGEAEAIELWFNAASDHLYEIEIPESLPIELRERITTLKDKCLSWGHGFGLDPKATVEDQRWAIKEAKELLREIDAAHGINTCTASWS